MTGSYVTRHGPLFDGQAEKALDRGAVAARHDIADKGVELARMNLAGSIRHEHDGRALAAMTHTDESRLYQTGKYTLPVMVGHDETVVTTDLATYGPWLEGDGSRNHTTRFKGYDSIRRAAQELEGRAGEIGQRAMDPYIEEMNA